MSKGFWEKIMRKEVMENSILTGHMEEKRSRGKQRIDSLTGLSGWVAIQG